MNIVRYAVIALAVSFASVAFGRLKLESVGTGSGEMSFTENSSDRFRIEIPINANENTYIFIYPLGDFSSKVSFGKRILVDDCIGTNTEVSIENNKKYSDVFWLYFGDGSIDDGFFNYWIIRSRTPRWDVFTNGYSSVSDACTTTNTYLIEVDKANDPLEITNAPPRIESFLGIGNVAVEQYSVRTCSVNIVDYDPVICKWEVAGSNYVQEIYQYGEQNQSRFVQPIAFDNLGPHRLTIYAKDKDMSGWVHKLVNEFTVEEPSIPTASLVSGRNRIENGKLYIPEYRIVSGEASERLEIDAIDYLKVKMPAPLSVNTIYTVSVGDVFDGDLNLLSKTDYDRGIRNSTTKSLEVWIYSGSTESEEVYLIDADGTEKTARGIRISAIEESSTTGTAYLDVCVTNCSPFIYMNNQYMSYRPGGSEAQEATGSNATSKWYVYDSYRDLVPRDGSSGRDFIVTNNIISISGYMATSGIVDPFDNVTNGVLKFLWSPGTQNITTRHYFQSIDKDGGESKKFFQLTRIPVNQGNIQGWSTIL